MNDIDRRTSYLEEDPGETAFNFGDLIRGVWRMRGWLVAGALIAALAATIIVLAFRVVSYEKTTNYIIEFRFAGRDNNAYPNGTPFSLSDIIAPAVLSQVYEDLNLGKFDLSFRDFQQSVSIAPYSVERQKLIEQFSRIDARRATVAEMNEAQQQLQRDLDTASKRYAALTFTAGGFAVPDNDVAQILTSIAKAWERNAVEVRKVVSLDLSTVRPQLFDAANLDGLERINMLKYVRDRLGALKAFTIKVGELPGGELISDRESGLDVNGVVSELDKASVQLIEASAGWSNMPVAPGSSEALGMPLNLYSERIFDVSQIKDLDYLIGVDLIQERIQLVRDNVRRILSTAFGDVTADPQTKLTARDVDRLVDDLDEYALKQVATPILSLGIAKNEERVRLYYDSRLDDLNRSKRTLASKAQILANAGDMYQNPGTSTAAQQAPQTGITVPSSTVIPQFGETFLDRIIELSQTSGDLPFRQKLVEDSVKLKQEEADLDAEIARISGYLDRFNAGVNSSDPNRADQMRTFAKAVEVDLPKIFDRLRGYAEITQRIAYRLRYANDLFETSKADNQTMSADFFLRDIKPAQDNRLPAIAASLKSYAEVANRLYALVSRDALGSYQTLFRAANQPYVVDQPFISRYQLLLISLATLVGFGLALVATVFNRLLEPKSKLRIRSRLVDDRA